ncbi:hypothetical protein K466DRAFT_588626 [Polyporus arcularius HHB13444]|uniref:N-acetyltransferase domain-containing protein n=1 Tax=Polyporus arcularius HHB13444 TaxID=1314778 RepID=A0A5C3P5P6_9APHY|nr:hypothetical protein K466DRAFT_588626 [Polyporus arcularius HHB13444]
MSPNGHPKAYVRPVHPSEHEAVVRVLTRAFARDPALNWFGCVPELVTDIDSPTPQDKRSMRNLSWFQSALVRMILIVKGVVAVVVVPGADGAASSTKRNAKEEVVGVALWLPPGQTLDLGPVTMLRAGILKVLFGFGLRGIKRLTVDFPPVLNGTLEKAFSARGLDWRDSWHLLEMVVDPIHQNRGYATLMMEDGYRRASPKPVHLEATRAFSRDIYLHYGFEIDDVHQYGVGEIDANGVRATGEAATGFPEWVMTKWTV